MTLPILEKEFKPAIIEIRKFKEDVKKEKEKDHLLIAIERENNYVYRYELDIYKDGKNDERNFFIVERIIKSILWAVGGYKIYISGSKKIYEKIKEAYSENGLRKFDYNFMSTVYEKNMIVRYVSQKEIPNEKNCSINVGGHLNGKRIGLDVGGSDIKVSALIDGKVISSEEIVWLPKLSEDISYQYNYLYNALRKTVDKLGGDVDAIGVSTAGVLVNNKPMVSSIFIKIPKEDFEKVKYSYINIINRLEKEVGHKIDYVIANDGDVTALAGSSDLNDNGVLGIAFGTSEAGGYVNQNGNLNGWFSELAFMPVDFNKNATVDEWSNDFGVGCKYFSQDAVIRLASRAGIVLDKNLTLAEQLRYVQSLLENDHEGAKQIFESIGVYLAYTIIYYKEFYDLKHVLILGRVTSGKGGDIILNVATKTLIKEFPEYSYIKISMPSEKMRRVGQSIAAASLPETTKY